jgi:uncharacterized SAM-binding protein YcdF (DUF218 family)
LDFYSAGKLFWLFAAPSHLLVWILALGLVLWRKAVGRLLMAAVVLFYGALLFVPLGEWALNKLENQYPRGPWPARVDGVLELGGGLSPSIFLTRHLPGAQLGEPRMVATFELARRYPKARIVFSGGSGDAGGVPETFAAREIFNQLGLPLSRISFEDRARDTWENFLYARPLAKPKPGEVWLLVTSAYHMPRAMAVARAQGWSVRPWPSDYLTMPRTGLLRFSPDPDLSELDLAAHEWVGLWAYRLTDRAR